MDSGSRKRLRRTRDSESIDIQDAASSEQSMSDDRLLDTGIPPAMEARFATAIFELGLKHSSPKILMPLMPADTNLSTEHIKSHLQKYRIHRQRSKDEFLEFFNNFMKDSYHRWDENRSWKRPSSGLDIVAMQNGSNISETSTSFINSYGTAPTQFPSSLTSLGALAPGINTHDFVKEEPSGAAVGQRCQAGRRAPPAGNSKEMGGYALDLFKETEGLLQSLQSLCQEATHGGDYQS